MAAISIKAPPGYQHLVPLHRETHASLGLHDQGHAWCAGLNAVPLASAEFASAAISYPIAFSRNDDTGEFSPLAVLGLRSGENLFVDTKGTWAPHSYVPAFVRRYPFCTAEIPNPKGGAAQRLVCFEQGSLVPGGQPLFNAKGEPSPLWEQTQRLLEAMESSRQQTRVLCKRLEALGLFTPFEALALPRAGKRMRLQGLFRVDEEKMNAIPGKDLRVMLRKGELRATYAHLVSLENFAPLMDRAVEREQHSTESLS